VGPGARQFGKRAAFTIVELLTVMSVIIILIGLLVPALNKVKWVAYKVKQKNQFHAIEVAMNLFNLEHEEYPPSAATDDAGAPYCGAMKFCEAMVGRDLLGFHPDSRFLADGTDGAGTQMYPDEGSIPDNLYRENLKAREGPYLKLSQVNAYRLGDLYSNTAPFDSSQFVLCDVYTRVESKSTGKQVGMPVLYFRANTSNTLHEYSPADNSANIYNVDDNIEVVRLGMPWMRQPPAGPLHQLASTPEKFYEETQNTKITTSVRPHHPDSYILLAAGFDGEYGTPDDIYNFGM
jgi:type II secretory pathway pseudopilin PulG